MKFPESIHLRDVTLRDGLQNESLFVPTDKKLNLLEGLLEAGFKRIEVTSFVHPKWIPSLRDADDLAARLPLREDVEYQALVPNQKGFSRFLESPVQTAVFFLSASTKHNEKNVNRTTEESLKEVVELIDQCVRQNRSAVAAIATSFVCPFSGIVPFEQIQRIAGQLVNHGIKELAIADTIGAADPRMIYERCSRLKDLYPTVEISLHLHDPKGYGLVNVLAAIEAGIRWFDVAQAGLGGCPYAPGAPGNLQASTLVEFLEKQFISTNLNLSLLTELDHLFHLLIHGRNEL